MPASKRKSPRRQAAKVTDSLGALAEALANRLLGPFDAVLLTRERIQETLEEATQRGRITRTDANHLAAELLRRGREQTDELLGELGRRARRTVGAGADRSDASGPRPPIPDLDSLNVQQVRARLDDLSAGELRALRDHEAGHRNRKSLLAAIDRALRLKG